MDDISYTILEAISEAFRNHFVDRHTCANEPPLGGITITKCEYQNEHLIQWSWLPWHIGRVKGGLFEIRYCSYNIPSFAVDMCDPDSFDKIIKFILSSKP